ADGTAEAGIAVAATPAPEGAAPPSQAPTRRTASRMAAVVEPRGLRIGETWRISVTFASCGRVQRGSARPAAGGSRVLAQVL
ncbi:MAG: hypothetical protein MUQ32_04840, partial [Chloroflexi bacterium]|nr:hypothetical protein [Chloroflexota bacterium]